MSISYEELIALRRAQATEKKRPQHPAYDPPHPTLPASSPPRGAAHPTNSLHGRRYPAAAAAPTPSSTKSATPSSLSAETTIKKAAKALEASPVPKEREPKVMAPVQHVRGEVSRTELIQRKRARMDAAATLPELLLARGVQLPAKIDGRFTEDYASGDVLLSTTSAAGEYASWLPLEAMDDDHRYEELTAVDWAARIEAAAPTGLPCLFWKAAQYQHQGKGEWARGHVTEVDVATEMYHVLPCVEGASAMPATQHRRSDTAEGGSVAGSVGKPAAQVLPRVFVCFEAEDVVNFADRFAAAHYRRATAEAALRLELYVDSIPVDEYASLDPLVGNRVRVAALSTPALVEGESNLNVAGALEEVRAGYSRVMNADLFRHTTHSGGLAQLMGPIVAPSYTASSASPLFVDEEARPVPVYGVQPGRVARFAATVQAFRAQCFWHASPVLTDLTRAVATADDALLARCAFVLYSATEMKRPIGLMDLEEVETAAVRESFLYARDTWLAQTTALVKRTLTPLPASAPVHLLHYDATQYTGCTTERYLRQLQFHMQDALQHYLISSLEAFVRFVEHASDKAVVVRGMADVAVTRGAHPASCDRFGADDRITAKFLEAPPYPLPPLLSVVLQCVHSAEESPAQPTAAADTSSAPPSPQSSAKPASTAVKAVTFTTRLEYSYTVDKMRITLRSLLTRCLTQHSSLRTVERALFNFLYETTTAFLDVPTGSCPLMESWTRRLDAVLERVEASMAAYKDTFSPLAPVIQLDIEAYMRSFDEQFPSTRGVEAEVRRLLHLQQQVLDSIPLSMDLGMLQVECAELRRFLSKKCAQASSRVLDVMAARAFQKEVEVCDQYRDLHAVLRKATETPEEVVATKDFIKTLPERTVDLEAAIEEAKEIHSLLNTFQRPLSEEEFNKKWKAIGWPGELDDSINERVEELEETKRCLLASMNRSQELFEREVDRMQKIVDQYSQHRNYNHMTEIAEDVASVQEKIAQLRSQANTFNTHETLFNIEKTDYSAVHQLAKDFEPYVNLWITSEKWATATKAWHQMSFTDINAEEVEQTVAETLRIMNMCVRSPQLTPELAQVAEQTRDSVQQFRPLVPTIKCLRMEGMKDRHWSQLSKEVGFDVEPGVTVETLSDVERLNLPEHNGVLMRISEVAAREYHIETSLEKMRAEWADMRMGAMAYKTTGCYIIKKDVVDATQEKLDDQTLLTQSLSFSPFKKLFEETIAAWEGSLKLVQDVLDAWLQCQKSWLYLEPIFQSEDISRQLPSEYKRFQQVHKNWQFLTNEAHRIDLTLDFCTRTERCLALLRENNNTLEIVERGLNQYLENKRASFARFYFLSDDELLTILSEARDPQKIQPQFRKLFENIARIDMRSPDNEMFGMYSHMEEYIPFVQSVLPRKYVENWLTEIETMMKVSIRAQLEAGLKNFVSMKRQDFVLQSPGQVAIAVNQIMWTQECEDSLHKHGSLTPYVETAQENLMLLVETVRQPLNNLQRMNLSGLITIEVHARDIVEQLAKAGVDSVYAFEWVSQLRSYWENNDCFLRQVEAQLRYGGEYLGNTTRLVITPLTDRIYLTLTGAMHMFLGGAPAGPAGTGKTETVKDLAKAVAKQCVVFNCQEGMTYASMGKFFKGLAQAGAWACFDEFNRIDVEVLSVVAQQVSSLQEAARTKQYRIPFEGTEIVVDPSYAVFITMNPGYAGRTELPDNLKVLFRPVACMVPDYAMIAEIRLFSFGYSDSRKLAQKMVATFRLSSEQLSSQDHYDFGMRAVNTVISAAGLMKREHPEEAEDVLLLRALRDSNAPKFLEEDLLLFDGIISDLFPGVQLTPVDYAGFAAALEEQAAKMHLQPTEMFVKKCVQLYEMSVLRHGQMAVGPTMGGKTCATRVLQAAMTELRKAHKNLRFAEVKTHCLNPKSITMAQLYGGFDEATAEWRDGIIGEIFRFAARDTTDARQWIIFDGPVDALWIESMNTVLDDNKKLCLISGEIIAMTPYMNCWFEVEDLAVASPATVSRAGMIYLEPDTCIGVRNYVRSWQQYRLPSSMDPYKEHLQELCEQLFPSLIQFVQTEVNEYSPSSWPCLVVSCFNLFDCFMGPYTPTRAYEVPQDKLDYLREIYLHLLVFSIVWSFGATGDRASRLRFDKFLRDELRLRNINIDLPVIGNLQDYQFVVEERRWVAWTERLPPFTTQVTQRNFSDIIVPTADVARYKYVNRLLLEHSYHTLCCGPTGTGKTVLMRQLLMQDMPKECTPIFFTFSARTSANQTQDLIFSKFEVRKRGSPQVWGAPLNKKFIILVDDMNMPLKEQYGAQPPVELLRQFMDYHGWYDTRTREFFSIVDVVMAGTMGPPGGGRHFITQRFLRHFHQIAFPDIEDDSMRRIFVSMLDSYFSLFSEDVRAKLSSVITASIEVFNVVLEELKPTPARPHYLFNMRDLAKVMDGLTNATPNTVKSVPALVRLWLHEEMRTFQDRLTSDADRRWFQELLAKQLQKHVKLTADEVLQSSRKKDTAAAAGAAALSPEAGGMSELLFVDFMGSKAEQRVYQEATDFGAVVKNLEQQLTDYNQLCVGGRQLDLVMFSDAVQHVCRIARVIRKPNGHALLLGVGGSGRQSLSRLAAHLNEYDLFQVEISKGYTMNAWREDLKKVLQNVAFHDKHMLFLFTDTQIVHEGMLEDVNNLLNSGEVPNLFVGPELEDLLNSMRPLCIAEGLALDKVTIFARFVRSCRAQLHIALCMSPLGEVFRSRLRMFPALVNCCTVDWFSAWPQQALRSVAHNYFAAMPLLEHQPTVVDACTEVCVRVHVSVEAISARFLTETQRHNYVTPTSFLEFLYTFRTLMETQTERNQTTKDRFVNGLEKLRETEDAVAGLQQTLAESQPVLLQTNESIKKLVVEMEVQTEEAEKTKREAQKEQEAVATMQAECAAIEGEAEGQLAEALPELDRALESLKNLKSSQITEVAGYKSPTAGVVMTVQGICIMFQIKPQMRAANPMEEKKPDYWATAKEQLLNNPNALLQRLIQYDKENIPERLIQAIMPLVSSEDFTPKKIAGASQACAAMCQWTHAMVRFHEVNKKVAPLRERLAVAQQANQEAQVKLREAEQQLAEVEKRLADMQHRKEEAEKELEELDQKVKRTALRLERAAMLIDGLAGEKRSWIQSAERLDESAQFLVGDLLVAAGQIAYCGPFTANYRQDLLETWGKELNARSIVHSPQFSIFHTLQDAVATREWVMNGLPMDTLSIENALFAQHARRWPLLIDPQTQGNRWIRKTYKDSLEVVKSNQKDLIKRIEFCIRAGRPVLLENVGEELDASLNPLLDRQTFMEGGTEMIRISDTPIPWNPRFKFFMTTKLPNPHYIPEVMVRVTLLNFFITPQGLEDQLLGVVVGQERKELEMRRSDLIQKNAAMKADLVQTQESILRKLKEVKGDVLDDVELIQYLNESKEKTLEITARVAEAEAAEVELTASREEYRPIAHHSSCLYFCCSTLSNVDPMYQYSLQWFVQLFIASIDQASRSDNLVQRLENLKDYFTYSFYQNVSRSLFEKHKLMFSFFLCVRLKEQRGEVDSVELRFLLQGPALVADAANNPDSSWITPSTWNDLCYLDHDFSTFKGLQAHLRANLVHYRELFMSSAAHRQPMAGDWAAKLTPMQHMMFLRCVRPDKLMERVQDFVTEEMGARFIRPPPFDLVTSFRDSSPSVPLIFILSQGADPYDDWKRFADAQNMSKKLYDISLGQGQGPRAERMMSDAMENGSWVLLQNCHLATSWMPTLERIVEGIAPATHPSFRLWLTSMPNAHFPVAVLQNGVKMTNEPPKGIQANVSRSIAAYSPDFLEACHKPAEMKKLFFSMCFFHALVQERRKFGPLGWNIAYEFTSGDLACCEMQIKMFLDKYAEVPYTVIRELSGNIHYGGRVTDDWDRRTLNTLLERFVTPDIMHDDYQFSPHLKEYRSIPATNKQGYLDYVASWPLNTNPETFGLHENADITCARTETFETLQAVVLLHSDQTASTSSSSTAAAAVTTPDDVVKALTVAIQGKVGKPFDLSLFRRKYPTMYEDSMNTVLVQEAIRFNQLVALLHQTLEQLPMAINGEVVMSKELEDVYRSLYNNQVPTMWADRAYPSLKSLGAWVDDLVRRLAMIQEWYDNGHPRTYWISGFFFPQAFLTGILQNYARTMHISIDTISYDFEWMNTDPATVIAAPEVGCYIHGMFIEGARIDFDTLTLAESKPKVLYEQAPMLWLKPVINREAPTEGIYACPLYKTVRRAGTLSTTGHSTNYVLTAEILTSPGVDPKHWIRRGVALVCALST
ncbi:putative dynein heavy chain [Leptomonas pyrrhocoris]|uniref:Putative dynein heavy chain n=1 Tax=Leptomonas pyrrhocoris TaxID=157538 RepID=A0A0M9G0Z5_LEPPY|nr:putative dynein heavy chain [Leptomonas pyrrhocoris]KPA79969.1 putative dynein heavy chain [Leptomonas pyrrhocoris]|eukprot:XP_015658408.1 putative dynein heavy chain [Leptomonas pyrrhocoris]